MCEYAFKVRQNRICNGKDANLFIFLPPPPFEKGGAYCFAHVGQSVGRLVGLYVGMSVSLNLVQLITQKGFAPQASNLVGR